MKQFKFYAPAALLGRLKALSDKTGIPQATILRNAIVAELDRMDSLASRIEQIAEGEK